MSSSIPISGHSFRAIDEEEEEKISRFMSESTPLSTHYYIRLNPGNWLLPRSYSAYAEKLANFKVRPTDIYVVTFSKTGTTWTQEIVWTMLYNPNLDNDDQHLHLKERSLFLDADMLILEDLSPEGLKKSDHFLRKFLKECPELDVKDGPNLQLAATQSDPRILKFHLPLSLLPKAILEDAKVIYVARDPRDVVCSLHHHMRLLMGFNGTVDDLCDLFIEDNVRFTPYWLHVKEAWERRDNPNFHFMLYEDMQKDIMKEIKKLDQFLGTHLSAEQMENVRTHTSFSEMKKRNIVTAKIGDPSFIMNPKVLQEEGGLFKQGKTGEGKKKLSPQSMEKLNRWIKERFDFGLEYN